MKWFWRFILASFVLFCAFAWMMAQPNVYRATGHQVYIDNVRSKKWIVYRGKQPRILIQTLGKSNFYGFYTLRLDEQKIYYGNVTNYHNLFGAKWERSPQNGVDLGFTSKSGVVPNAKWNRDWVDFNKLQQQRMRFELK